MNTKLSQTNHARAFTLVELLAVIGCVWLLAMLFSPCCFDHSKIKASRIKCVNNLKNVGLAFRIFATDHGDKFPMALSTNHGGSSEYAAVAAGTFGHYLALSNELSTPKIVLCRSDAGRTEARRFFPGEFGNSNVSYFVGLDAAETQSQSILSGDRNITNGSSKTDLRSYLINFGTNVSAPGPKQVGWNHAIHQHQGNVVLGDGSVQQLNSSRLREQMQNSGVSNIFSFP